LNYHDISSWEFIMRSQYEISSWLLIKRQIDISSWLFIMRSDEKTSTEISWNYKKLFRIVCYAHYVSWYITVTYNWLSIKKVNWQIFLPFHELFCREMVRKIYREALNDDFNNNTFARLLIFFLARYISRKWS